MPDVTTTTTGFHASSLARTADRHEVGAALTVWLRAWALAQDDGEVDTLEWSWHVQDSSGIAAPLGWCFVTAMVTLTAEDTFDVHPNHNGPACWIGGAGANRWESRP